MMTPESQFPVASGSVIAPMTPRSRILSSPFAPPSPFPILQSSVVVMKDQEIGSLRETIRRRDARIMELESQVEKLTGKVSSLEIEVARASKPSPPPEPFVVGQSVDLTDVPIKTLAETSYQGNSKLRSPVKTPLKASSPMNFLPSKAPMLKPGNLHIPAHRASSAVRFPSRNSRTPRPQHEVAEPAFPSQYKADSTDAVDSMMAAFFSRCPESGGKLLRINRGFYRVFPAHGDENSREMTSRSEFEAEIVNGVLMVRASGWNNEKLGRPVRLFKDLGLL